MDERLAGKVVDCLDWLRENRNMAIYAYCLMPDHLHLLIQPASAPDDVARPSMAGRDVYTLSDVIGSMKQFTTRQAWELGHRGVLRQERFYEHVVRKSEDGVRIAQYILDNPVRKGLVTAAEDYRWSGMPDPLT